MSYEKLMEHSDNTAAFLTHAKSIDSTAALISPAENQWSPAFIAHHLADAQMHFAIRYFNALTIPMPSITPFDEELYPGVLNYGGRDWKNSLRIIEAMGDVIRTTLEPLNAKQWERKSMHPEIGQVSISKLITKASAHLAAHTEQLKEAM